MVRRNLRHRCSEACLCNYQMCSVKSVWVPRLPSTKLCFTVNPRKKYVKVKVRVHGFKKAVDKALRRAALTQFQQRMFGTKVGNALHDIARLKSHLWMTYFRKLTNLTSERRVKWGLRAGVWRVCNPKYWKHWHQSSAVDSKNWHGSSVEKAADSVRVWVSPRRNFNDDADKFKGYYC